MADDILEQIFTIISKIIFAPIWLILSVLEIIVKLLCWLIEIMPKELMRFLLHLFRGNIIACIPRFYFRLSVDDNSRRFSLDHSSQASNPGTVRINWFQWIKYHPFKQLAYIIVFAAAAGGALMFHWSLWSAVVILIYFNILYWQTVQEFFLLGCINPGVIISVDPMLVAVSTDLSKWEGDYPAIKIIKANLKSVRKNAEALGTLVPTVATYGGSADDIPHWNNFYPIPVEYANRDMNIIVKSLDSIGQQEIKELEKWLKQIPEPYKCGLFMMTEENC